MKRKLLELYKVTIGLEKGTDLIVLMFNPMRGFLRLTSGEALSIVEQLNAKIEVLKLKDKGVK